MKKQMTILAAAAILGTFAVGAMAGVPTVTFSGTFDYGVEYNLLSRDWVVNPAESALNTALGTITFSVATAGNPNLGTMSISNAWPGAMAATISGTVKGVDVSLGAVNADWDGMSAGTAGAGATVGKAFGPLSVKLATTANVAVVPATNVVNAARVAATLGTASIYGGLVLDPTWKGLGYLGATSKMGPATVTAKAGMILGGASAFSAQADLAAGPALKLQAVVAVAPALYAGSHINAAASGSGVPTDLMIPGWVAANRAGSNLFLRADLAVNPNLAPYGTFDYRAGTGDYTLVAGTSFKPLFVNSASVTLRAGAVNNTEFNAALGKGIVSATLGYRVPTVGAAESMAEVRVDQTIEWLKTWAAIGKAYGVASATYIKVGASAMAQF